MPKGANGLNGTTLLPLLLFMLTGCSICTLTDTTAGRTLAIRLAKPLTELAACIAGATVAASALAVRAGSSAPTAPSATSAMAATEVSRVKRRRACGSGAGELVFRVMGSLHHEKTPVGGCPHYLSLAAYRRLSAA